MILRALARSILGLLTGLFLASSAAAAPVKTEHLEVELVAGQAAAVPGATVYVALHQKIAKDWHTYWRNSGDAGAAPELRWTLPKGWSAGETVWPAPRRMPEATLMTYGFEDEVWLPIAIRVPAGAKIGETVHLAAVADILVCKDICIPETFELGLDLPVAASPGALEPTVAKTLVQAPKPLKVEARARLEGGVLKIGVAGPLLAKLDPAGAYFFPYSPSAILHAERQAVERGPDGLTLTIKPAPSLAKGLTGPIEGVLQTRSGAWEISARPGDLPNGAGGLGPVASAGEAEGPSAPTARFPVALMFALIGGLLLNLMPCVFPVLSMKAAHLAERAHEPATARRDGLWFLAGTLTTFVVLALVLISAKAAGQAIGWGFQLQSPQITALLALLTLGIALNLSGVFDAGTSLQGLGLGLQQKSGRVGAFFTGVLAVVVGAPCTAPFMASAIGYALTANAAQTLIVFLALGVGLAAPFVALSFSPALLQRLPRPGAWMEKLRNLLAFPMYGTAAFMAWVFAQQTGAGPQGALLGAAVFLALALFLFGGLQKADAPRLWRLGVIALSLTIAASLAVWAAMTPVSDAPRRTSISALPEEPWSAARVTELTAQGRPVLVNFTAAWCVTCKVNEAVAFSDPRTAKAFQRHNVAYLVADWTRRDPAIAAALAEYGRSGVPLYLLYSPGKDRARVLPQVLTGATIARALDAGAAPPA